MTERPILFAAPMVRAILNGAKTQTRRIVKPQPPSVEAVRAKAGVAFHLSDRGAAGTWRVMGPVWAVRELLEGSCGRSARADVGPQWRCPYGVPGDRLWVREAWAAPPGSDAPDDVAYRADLSESQQAEEKTVRRVMKRSPAPWKPGIHMPRWASRILLEITDVRVQLLHDISEEDAQAEGVPGPHFGRWTDEGRMTPPESEPPRPWAHSFYVPWRELYGHDVFPPRVWAWALTFRRVD